jgi:hypothetical protein
MNKLLLATALLATFSMPAMAAYPGGKANVSERHAGAMRERASRQMLPRRTERGEFKDPYWTPCDYSISWGPNSCE